ncbi:MAG TPA: hypothetical protein VF070_42105 [Streptosporangiaceae bacterium]
MTGIVPCGRRWIGASRCWTAAQAILRRVSVFATPFTAQDAAALITGWPPVTGTGLAAGLAMLADHSLLEAITGPEATRYRALETIRQYASERLAAASEAADAHARHASWCLHGGAALSASSGIGTGAYDLNCILANSQLIG